MASSYKKGPTKISSPRKTASGMSQFAHVNAVKNAPLKTRIYTKGILRTDPSAFPENGFGDTGLQETPSIIGMGRSAGI